MHAASQCQIKTQKHLSFLKYLFFCNVKFIECFAFCVPTRPAFQRDLICQCHLSREEGMLALYTIFLAPEPAIKNYHIHEEGKFF